MQLSNQYRSHFTYFNVSKIIQTLRVLESCSLVAPVLDGRTGFVCVAQTAQAETHFLGRDEELGR